MPEAKMSSFFKKHFGSVKTKEEALKTSVKQTLKRTASKIANPISKRIVKINNKNEFEEVMISISTSKINSLNSAKVLALYIKFLELYGKNASKVSVQTDPQKAAQYLTDRATKIKNELHNSETLEKLTELAARIRIIKSRTWKILVVFFDNAFDNKKGDKQISQVLDSPDTLSENKLIAAIQNLTPQTTPKSTISTSPSNTPTQIRSTPPQKPTSPSATPTTTTRPLPPLPKR